MDDTRLLEVLERSRSLGFLGPGSVRVHLDHAAGFAAGIERAPLRFLDLGSGGGVPGLVLARRWPESQVVLLDARERRCAVLREAAQDLRMGERVAVVWARAEEAGHRDDLRGRFDLVVARGFGPPAVTAECGAPFLEVGGTLAVSEPPLDDGAVAVTDRARWAPAGLARLGLAEGRSWTDGYHYQALDQIEPCPQQYARRAGIPAKRPLF
ncbi:MAG: 16S rRNA (guanine(527)-N(7))-methyltransferase RsmG [Acidimicrobiales bacterium]